MGFWDLLKKPAADAASSLISSIGNTVDQLVTNKEEKEKLKYEMYKATTEYQIKLEELAMQKENEYLKDTQDARAANVKIQESTSASKLAKSVAYFLDIFIVSGFFAMLGLIIFKAVPTANKEVFYTGFGVLGSMTMTVLNFHRGTSIGS